MSKPSPAAGRDTTTELGQFLQTYEALIGRWFCTVIAKHIPFENLITAMDLLPEKMHTPDIVHMISGAARNPCSGLSDLIPSFLG